MLGGPLVVSVLIATLPVVVPTQKVFNSNGAHSVQPVNAVSPVALLMAANAENFVNWEGGWQYGGAVTLEGFARLMAFPATNATVKVTLANVTNRLLAAYEAPGNAVACNSSFPYGAANTFRNCAYGVLHNESYRWDTSIFNTIGDHFGIWPIVNLNRFVDPHSMRLESPRETDLRLAVRVALDYNLRYPFRIPDGTFSRTNGFSSEPVAIPTVPNHQVITTDSGFSWPSFLWADDQFMGLALFARLARLTDVQVPSSLAVDLGASQRKALADVAALMQLSFYSHLHDPHDGWSDSLLLLQCGVQTLCSWL